MHIHNTILESASSVSERVLSASLSSST